MKKFGIAVLVIVLLVVVAPVIYVLTLDASALRGPLESAIRDATGREVSMSALVFEPPLTPRIEVADLKLASATWASDAELIEVREVAVTVALIPLLSKRIEIRDIVAQGVRISLESDTAGRKSWDFGRGTTGSESSSPAILPRVDALQLKDVVVSYKTPKATREIRIEQASVTESEGSLPLRINAAVTVDGHSIKLDGKTQAMEVLFAGQAQPFEIAIVFAGAKGSFKGRVNLSADGVPTVDAAVDITVDDDRTLRALAGAQLPALPVPLEMTGTLTGTAKQFELGELTVKTAEFSITTTGTVSVADADITFALTKVDARLDKLEALNRLAGGTIPDLQTPLAITGTLSGTPSHLTIGDITGRSKGLVADTAGTFTVTGSELSFKLVADVSVETLAALQGLAIAESIPTMPFPVKAHARLDGTLAALAASAIDLQSGEHRVKGALDIRQGERLSVIGTVEADRLDLRPFLTEKKNDADKPGKKSKRVFSTEPLSLEALDTLDAKLDLRVNTLVLPSVVLEKFLAPVRLQHGTLSIDRLSADFAGGQISARIALAKAGKEAEVSVNSRLENLDVAALMEAVGSAPDIEGRVNANAALSGKGGSIAAIMGSLNGKTNLLMGKGRMRSVGLDQMVGGLGAVVATFGEKKSEWSTLNCLASDFDVRKGIAKSRVMLLDSEFATVIGEGNINLGAEKLRLLLTPSSKSATLNISLPIKVRGTFVAPSFAPDEAASAMKIGALLGATLFPPAALAAFVDTGSGDDNPCLQIAAQKPDSVRTNVSVRAPKKKSASKSTTEDMADKAADVTKAAGKSIKGAVEGLGKSLKGLFGN